MDDITLDGITFDDLAEWVSIELEFWCRDEDSDKIPRKIAAKTIRYGFSLDWQHWLLRELSLLSNADYYDMAAPIKQHIHHRDLLACIA